jgi:hypothetical protein
VNDAAKARNVEGASEAAVGCDHDLDLSTCQTILSTLTKNLGCIARRSEHAANASVCESISQCGCHDLTLH